MIQKGIDEGATLALDGRGVKVEGREKGYFVGPTVFTDVKPGMEIHKIEIFGPVQCIMKVDSLDEAIQIINDHLYGNGASIYTQNGYYARRFKLEAKAGMIGVNIGIPAPVAFLPFGGMKAQPVGEHQGPGPLRRRLLHRGQGHHRTLLAGRLISAKVVQDTPPRRPARGFLYFPVRAVPALSGPISRPRPPVRRPRPGPAGCRSCGVGPWSVPRARRASGSRRTLRPAAAP